MPLPCAGNSSPNSADSIRKLLSNPLCVCTLIAIGEGVWPAASHSLLQGQLPVEVALDILKRVPPRLRFEPQRRQQLYSTRIQAACKLKESA